MWGGPPGPGVPSGDDAPVGLLALCMMLTALLQLRVQGAPPGSAQGSATINADCAVPGKTSGIGLAACARPKGCPGLPPLFRANAGATPAKLPTSTAIRTLTLLFFG